MPKTPKPPKTTKAFQKRPKPAKGAKIAKNASWQLSLFWHKTLLRGRRRETGDVSAKGKGERCRKENPLGFGHTCQDPRGHHKGSDTSPFAKNHTAEKRSWGCDGDPVEAFATRCHALLDGVGHLGRGDSRSSWRSWVSGVQDADCMSQSRPRIFRKIRAPTVAWGGSAKCSWTYAQIALAKKWKSEKVKKWESEKVAKNFKRVTPRKIV